MSAHFINMDRADRFGANITDDRRNPELRVLVVKGFDTVSLTLTQSQLRAIGEAIAKETGGGSPF